MAKLLASLAALAFFVLPLAASASALSDLQVKLQSLLSQVSAVQQQIAALQATSGTPATGPAACSLLLQHFSLGTTDATTAGGVSVLQKALAADPSLYPEGLVTGYFGPATTRAVTRLASRCVLSGGVATSTSSISGLSAQTGLPLISIDQSSLIATSSAPVITGTAQNVSMLILVVDAGNAVSYENDSVPVTNGVWSATTSPLSNGAYKVTARSIKGNAVAAGYLIVSALAGASNSATASSSSSSIVTLSPLQSENPEVSVSVNGSTRGATTSSGSLALIGWTSKYASACTISSDHPSALSGSVLTFGFGSSSGSLTQTTTFTVTCTGNSGQSASGSVTVTVVPR
jgi:hypothetical protein